MPSFYNHAMSIVMNTPRKIKGKKYTVDLSILSARREEKAQQTANRVANQVCELDRGKEYDLIFQLASHPKLPEMLNPVYAFDRKHYDALIFSNRLSADGFMHWTLGLFYKNEKTLSEFLELQQKVTFKILKNEPDAAFSLLDEIDSLSKSWWSIHTRTHITKEIKKEDTKSFLSTLQDLFPKANVSNSIIKLQLMSEGSAIGVYLNDTRSRLAEYRSSGIQQAIEHGGIESCTHLPKYLDPDRRVELYHLKSEVAESIIDQFVTFKEVVFEKIANGSLSRDLKDKIYKIADRLGDHPLKHAITAKNSTSEQTLSVVNDYTIGNYSNVVLTIGEMLKNENPAIFGLIEIYAKSKIYLESNNSRETFLDQLAGDLSSILQCEKNTVEKIENLSKLTVKFKTEAWAKSLSFHLLSILEETTEPHSLELARLETVALGDYNTPKALHGKSAVNLINHELLTMLPSYRAAKYFTPQEIGRDLTESTFPVKSDYLKLKAHTFLESGALIEAAYFAVAEYQKNNVSFHHLPFGRICDEMNDIEPDSDNDRIVCLAALDIYHKEFNSRFEELKSEKFEDYIFSAKTHRLSSVFSARELTPNEVYFLHQICIPSQLDNLFQYKSNDEVVHERVAIIDLLIKARPQIEKQLRLERDSVLEGLFVEKLRAKIESGKLYVDVQEIEAQRKHVYAALFNQAKSIPGGVALSPLPDTNSLEGSRDLFRLSDTNAIAATEKAEILYTIFVTAVDDFALNENYGLDKYLSAEIRHIVFEAQLRSCFEKTHLVTPQKEGVYTENTHWKKHYQYVNTWVVSSIDAVLREFSKKVDDTLSLTNEQFRVDVRQENSEGIFDFKAYHHRLVRISEIVESSENAEHFFKALIDYMWEIASESARRAQLLIANDLAGDINDLLNGLEDAIAAAKADTAMLDLTQEIKTARSMFTKEIEVVLNWFKFVGDQSTDSLERLGVVIEASVSSFESIYGHGHHSLQFSQSKSNLLLTYRESRSLFIAIFTALENAQKYSKDSSPIILEHQVTESRNTIKIINSVSIQLATELDDIITAQKLKWTPENLCLNTSEGGTGLYKIFSILTSCSIGFEFDITRDNDTFSAIVELNNESFSDRRQPA